MFHLLGVNMYINRSQVVLLRIKFQQQCCSFKHLFFLYRVGQIHMGRHVSCNCQNLSPPAVGFCEPFQIFERKFFPIKGIYAATE
jgi:hypothetical protein